MSIRIGVDVGGTFTDIVCFDEHEGRLSLVKVPSTPGEPHRAVVQGAARILRERGLAARDVAFFIHGTTVATNTVLERKGAAVALLVTEGFRDILYVMRQDRPRLYDYFVQRPEPLVPRRLRLEVPERTLFDGALLRPIEEAPVRRLLARLRDEGIRDVAVCLLHSYRNPAHERLLERWILEEIPEARVSVSSEILPEFKEFERMSTTVVNAYVRPRVGEYVERLQAGLAGLGVASGLHIMKSNGGIMSARAAATHCVHTVLSGPAAGAVSGLDLGRQAGFDSIISIDVGGTSADVAVARGGRLQYAEETEVAGQVIKVPAIEIHTVGAGGGSIAWIDRGGALQVGPRSAGAEPGPACYGRGGTEPTVTDANLALGRLNPAYFLGGAMPIDPAPARRAVEAIAAPLGLGLEQAAEGIIRVIDAVMAKAIRHLSVEKGYDPREFTLVAFGGAGPVHAASLAAELRIPRVLVPPAPGVSSALGLLTADFRHDHVQTLLRPTAATSRAEFEALVAELAARARREMHDERVADAAVELDLSADLRYRGQGFALQPRFTLGEIASWTSLEPLAERFHDLHQEVYGYSNRREPTEIVNVRLVALGKLPQPRRTPLPRLAADPAAARTGTRPVYFDRWWETPVYQRDRLGHGHLLAGPAVIEQIDSTTLVFPGQSAAVDALGNLVLQLEAEP
jgi:N-methylhydantoinase A